jgi:RNA polymerase sigma-70 factor (sigma-E family)
MGSAEGVLVADGQAAALPAAAEKLEVLYDAHVRGATRLAFLLTGDQHLAEDLTQDAFVKVAGRFHDLRNADAFGGYLRRTIVNLSNGYFRRLKVERSYLDRERASYTPSSDQLPDVAARDEVLKALGGLPARQRAVIVLRYYEDLSEQQAADVLGCSVGAVKSLANRAMVSLRGSLDREGAR